jgi:UDP-glucuronate 4-epimerase
VPTENNLANFSSSPETILVTGAAGFIGFHVARNLLAMGHNVVGVDTLNDYYEVSLKRARLAELEKSASFRFKKHNLAKIGKTAKLFDKVRPDRVVHLAAQPGVRYSLINPQAYVESNVAGFVNVLEGCRATKPKHFVYASSSSIYGANSKIPYSVGDPVDQPMSLYASTKRANEMMAQSYSHLYGIAATGLRFFTVYGPWGRPDMAVYSFTKAIDQGKTIQVFNNGDLRRDFTYIDDIVDGVLRCLVNPPQVVDAVPKGSRIPAPPHRIYNIGNNQPVELMHMIETIEKLMGKKATKEFLPMQPGDVFETFADIAPIQQEMGFSPSTSIEKGLEEFVKWYRAYHGG